MRTFYPICRLLIITLFSSLFQQNAFCQSESHDMITYDTSVNYSPVVTQHGKPVKFLLRITRPRNYFTPGNPDAAPRPAIITMPGTGETGTDPNNLTKYGPHFWMKNGWDGGVPLGNGIHYPIFITIEQGVDNSSGRYGARLFDSLIKWYHLKKGSIHVAGLSHGSAFMADAITWAETPGDHHSMSQIKSWVAMESIGGPQDGGSPGNANPASSFPGIFQTWAASYGGKAFAIEGTQDSRGSHQLTEAMNSVVPNSAYLTYEDDGGGKHCCWNDFYNPSVGSWENLKPPYGNPYIAKGPHPNTRGSYTGNGNIYTWMLRQGDTTLIAGAPSTPPTVNAGSSQTLQLPVNSLTVTGTATANGGHTIASALWTKTSGPAPSKIGSPSNLSTTISGLAAGTYVFTLKVTDNIGQATSSSKTVTVLAAIPPPPPPSPPTVNAGSSQTIQLPVNSLTVAGTAKANGGHTVASVLWTKTNGPAQFKIASPSSLSTTISGLVAGTYVFTLKVTDNNGQATSSSKTVNVLALVPPTVSAGPNQTVTLPKDSVILTGTAAGKNGATIKSVKWSQVGGPSADEIYSPNNLSTKLKGLKAGVCKYELSATDNNGITATASVTVTVNPAPPPPPPKETGGGQTSKPVSGGDGKTVNVSIYGGSNPYSDPQWNNWAISTGAATNISSPAFKYSNGNASTISANLSQSTAIADNGTAYAQSGGMAPGGVLRYTSYSTTSRTLTITGLSTAKKYEIDLYASRNLNDGNTTDFVAGGKTGGVSTYNNLNNKAVFTALVPDAQGKVVINISETVTYNYVNGFTLREDTVSSPKYVKVNVYGGANPFNDPQWNNWAISTGASAIMSSSEFRYSDGSASTVWATLTQSTAIADNGVKYALTGAMAPAGVLRYTSYSTVPRNLVISGLSTSKKYDLELYASRDLNKGNNTVFAVPGLNTSVPSYNNLVDKAIFSGLQPNTYGRITISMGTDAGTYNYLNGFVLTEGSSATTAAVNAPQIHAISGQASAEGPTQNSAEGAGDILRIWPNPVQDAFTLELSNEQRGNLQVQIIDRNGSVRKVFNLVKDQTHITQTFSIGGLSPGPYVLKVQNVGWVGVIELVKM